MYKKTMTTTIKIVREEVPTVRDMIDKKIYIDYAIYAKQRDKIVWD